MTAILLAALAAVPAEPPTHESINPAYKSLLDPGLLVGTDIRAKFPAPTMADGLDAVKQKAVIVALIGNDFSWDDFTRKSIVASHIFKIRDVTPADPKAPARGIDVYFIAYGDFKAVDDEKFLDRLVNSSKNEGKSKELTRDDLAKRKIVLTAEDEKREHFGNVEFDFLDKVRIKATGRAVWSKLGDSAVVAAEVDPRFVGDADFPNQWQSLTKGGDGVKVGPVSPWSGAGFYLKITKLAEPAGALFIEQHVIFTEPKGWFDGANLLRSKLPSVMQNNVRSMRREWSKFVPGK